MTSETHFSIESGYDDPIDGGHECPVCGELFHRDEWQKTFGVADPAGAAAGYDCPTDGCEGDVTVHI